MKPRPKAVPDQRRSRADRKADTRARVLKAALAVFAECGFEAASTAEIARRAGVSHGTVFVVAPTKLSLAVAAHEGEIRGVAAKALTTLPQRGGLQAQIAHLYEALFDYLIVLLVFFRHFSSFNKDRSLLGQAVDHLLHGSYFFLGMIVLALKIVESFKFVGPDSYLCGHGVWLKRHEGCFLFVCHVVIRWRSNDR